MSIIKTLKKIHNCKTVDENGKPIIYDFSSPKNLILKDLKKRGLIDYTTIYLKHGIGAINCTVTKEGLEYIEKHKEKNIKFLIQTFSSMIVSIITGVLVTLILVYIFHISK